MAKRRNINWIQQAIQHPGALHKQMHVPMGKKIPAAMLRKAANMHGVEGRRARMALTLRKINRKKGY